MSLVLEKLDRRHVGNEFFKHRVWISDGRREGLLPITEIRNWCWEVWGASAERDYFVTLSYMNQKIYNEHWAWHTDANGHVYIYLTNDQALAFFKLKWM